MKRCVHRCLPVFNGPFSAAAKRSSLVGLVGKQPPTSRVNIWVPTETTSQHQDFKRKAVASHLGVLVQLSTALYSTEKGGQAEMTELSTERAKGGPNLSVSFCIRLTVYLSDHLSTYLSNDLPTYLCICPSSQVSVSLSVYL